MGYRQDKNNGVLKSPKSLSGYDNQEGSLRFADNVAEGENDKGMTAFTPNGPSRVRKGEAILKDNFGRREDGDHYDYGIDVVPAQSLQGKKK